jgi:hypothetical protein
VQLAIVPVNSRNIFSLGQITSSAALVGERLHSKLIARLEAVFLSTAVRSVRTRGPDIHERRRCGKQIRMIFNAHCKLARR